jgi:hypothetical protein
MGFRWPIAMNRFVVSQAPWTGSGSLPFGFRQTLISGEAAL